MVSPRRSPFLGCLALIGAVWFGIAAAATWTQSSGTDAQASRAALPLGLLSRQTKDMGLDLSVRDVADQGSRSVGAFEDAVRPYRLEITYRAPAPNEAGLFPSGALVKALGPACFSQALGPLVSAEAAGGDLPYVLGIVLDAVGAAREVGRLPPPLPGPSELLALCAAGLAAAVLALRRSPALLIRAVSDPPDFMARDRAAVWAEQDRLNEAARVAREVLAAKEAANAQPAPARSLIGRLNVARNMRERSARKQASAEARALADQVVQLEAEIARARDRQSKVDRAVMDHAEAQERRHGRRVMLRALASTVPKVSASAVFGLALMHAVAAFISPGLLLPPVPATPLVIRGDTLIATALAAHPEYEAGFAEHCLVKVAFGEPPGAVVPASLNVEVGGSTGTPSVRGPVPGAAAGAAGPRCVVGVPCGGACIPSGRTCRITTGDPVRGKACGDGYIALAKTCRIDQPLSVRVEQPARMETRPYSPADARQAFTPPSGGAGTAYSPSPAAPTGMFGAGNTAPPPSTRSDTVHVQGYTKQNGTVVQPYDRAAPGKGNHR